MSQTPPGNESQLSWGGFSVQRDAQPSLPEVNSTIEVPKRGGWYRRFLAFAGPGYMVSVGYMDPGNWATDIAGGSKFGYTLLSIILLSNLMAILLQALSARLGIVTGRDLAQSCRDSFSKPVNLALWFICEIAIISCDLAEVIGTAIALKLLFGLPLLLGVILAALDALLILLLMNRGFRSLEAFIIALLIIIMVCFAIQIFAAQPPIKSILNGLMPSSEIVLNPEMLYIAMGIIGATVMPHNLYLHSSIVQTRAFDRNESGIRQAIHWATIDSTLALSLAFFVNAAILVLAAVAFHDHGYTEVNDIEQAHHLLSPLLGLGVASTLFAVALLASGVNSTVTATLAGQIVMEGFLRLRLPLWARRLLTRGLAIIPVILVILIYGDQGTADLLVFSQVILSMQLPFAIVPLLFFVCSKQKMGRFVIPSSIKILAWIVATIIILLNIKLLLDTLG